MPEASTGAANNADVLESPIEPEKPIESEEQVDLDEDNDPEEAGEEEVEYEEVEEEEEVEVEEDEYEDVADRVDAQKQSDGDEEMKVGESEEDEKKKHAELLALPPHGSEVYLGALPHDASEEDLRDFCEPIGEVREVRYMAKGYAFVTFRTKELAFKAIEELNNSEFKDPQNASRNHGFAFIEYYNHACAEYSRKKMSNPTFKLDDNAPTVSWADPRNTESSAANRVKALYVKNLPKDITQDKELFERHGKITKFVVPLAKVGHENIRYGFVHFAERSSAMKALKNTEKYKIDVQVLECSLAKPQADQKNSGGPNSQNSPFNPSYLPRIGYGTAGGAYGAPSAGYISAGFAQPMIYGSGAAPAGMAMLPMLLPDGWLGYVLQQAGVQQHTPPQPRSGRGGAGNGSSGRRWSTDSGQGRSRYNPY